MDSEKYAKFDVKEVTYKVVNGQDIKAYVLTPKGIVSGIHPVVAKFHGGSFITGASMYPDWWPQWALDYSTLHSAIIVTGDYRLLPESTGMDIHEDICSFWDWVREDLNPYLSIEHPGLSADLSKILVHGESAGGTLSLLSGFNQPPGFIKAIVSMYPVTTLKPEYKKPMMGMEAIPPTVLAAHLAAMVPGKIVTSVMPYGRMDIAFSIAQQGSIEQFWGKDQRMDLFKLLEKAQDVPYTLVLHGEEDSLVPISGTREWAELMKAKFGDKVGKKFDIHTQPGAEHGFDVGVPLETPWLQEKLKKVTEAWLGTSA